MRTLTWAANWVPVKTTCTNSRLSSQVTAVHEQLKPVYSWTMVWATVAPQAIRSSKGTVFIALSLSSGFTAENEVAVRVGELYVNNGGVCGRLTLKAKSQKGQVYLSFRRKTSEVLTMADEDVQKTLEELSRELQDAKARLEGAQRIAHVGHYYWNLIENRVIWSDELYRIYGLSPQEGPIDMAMVREMIHPEDREFVFRTAEEALHSEVRADIEHRVVRTDGEVRTVHALGTVKRDASGRPYEMFGTVQDITDRKRAEETLQQTQVYLREGQRLAHMGSWAFNDLGHYWSDELYEIFGLDPENGVPAIEQYLAFIHPEDRASMAETIQIMYQQHAGCDVTKRIVRPDGQLRYVRCVAIPVIEQGVFKGLRGSAIDVTEQELLTQELRRQQAYLAEAQSLTHV